MKLKIQSNKSWANQRAICKSITTKDFNYKFGFGFESGRKTQFDIFLTLALGHPNQTTETSHCPLVNSTCILIWQYGSFCFQSRGYRTKNLSTKQAPLIAHWHDSALWKYSPEAEAVFSFKFIFKRQARTNRLFNCTKWL